MSRASKWLLADKVHKPMFLQVHKPIVYGVCMYCASTKISKTVCYGMTSRRFLVRSASELTSYRVSVLSSCSHKCSSPMYIVRAGVHANLSVKANGNKISPKLRPDIYPIL